MTSQSRAESTRRFGFGGLLAAVVVSVVLTGTATYFVTSQEAEPAGQAESAEVVAKEQWQCPMHPTIVQDHPGTCPICGMNLVDVSAGGAPENDKHAGHANNGSSPEGLATVTIDPARQQLIGLTMAHVERAPGAPGPCSTRPPRTR